MQIIIVGCGKVGATLAKSLAQEQQTDLTLIDTRPEKLEAIADELDALTIEGNGASFHTLMEAEIEKADLLIAVTGSDELNLLCCLIAQKAGSCATIARVRNPVYSEEINFIKERLGIKMIINPEQTAAEEIARLHRVPTAIKIDNFARTGVDLLKIRVLPEHRLDGLLISDIAEKYHLDILVCGIENADGVTIPSGSDRIHDGDLVTILCGPENTVQLFKKIGLKSSKVRNAILIGGGTTCYYTAHALLKMNIDVKIVEKNKDRCEELSDLLPEATIINGDGTDRALLLEEGLETTDSVVALTNMDEENVFLSLYCKSKTKAKLVAKVNRLEFDDILDPLDIGSLVFPKYLTADRILRYVRAMENASGSNVETLYHILDGRAEALEFVIRDNSPVLGVPLAELHLKPSLLVGSLNRNGKTKVPRGQDTLEIGDTVIIITTQKGLKDISDILA